MLNLNARDVRSLLVLLQMDETDPARLGGLVELLHDRGLTDEEEDTVLPELASALVLADLRNGAVLDENPDGRASDSEAGQAPGETPANITGGAWAGSAGEAGAGEPAAGEPAAGQPGEGHGEGRSDGRSQIRPDAGTLAGQPERRA